MKNYDLQMFGGEAVQGKKIIYLYRKLSQAAQEDAWVIAYTTENGRTVSVDADSTATKDGAIRTPGVPEIEITGTSVLSADSEKIDELEEAMLNNELMEIWEVNLARAGMGENKFKGKYYQGYLTEFEQTSNAEDFCEVSLTFGINGTGKSGECTVSAEQQAEASYAFKDTVKTGA